MCGPTVAGTAMNMPINVRIALGLVIQVWLHRYAPFVCRSNVLNVDILGILRKLYAVVS